MTEKKFAPAGGRARTPVRLTGKDLGKGGLA